MAEQQTGIRQLKPGELNIDGKTFKGVTYNIEGRDIELYRIGALAAALDKTPQQIVEWERLGLFPKPCFRISGEGLGHCERWYSKEQIINIRKVWKIFPLRRGAGRHKTNFFHFVKQVFYKFNIVTLTVKGNDGQKETEHHSNAGAAENGREPG